MNKIKAVIFDMDGLMIDSEPIQSKSFEIVLKEYGIKPKYQKNGLVQIIGVRAGDNWGILKKKHKISETVEVLIEKKQKAYIELLTENIKPTKGLIYLLKLLKKHNIRMGIASSSSLEHIMLVIKSLDITDYFDEIISGHDVVKGKPDPEIFLKTAENLQVLPNQCIVLEDAESGVQAAHAAGMRVIAVPTYHTSSHNFEKADIIAKSLLDVDMELLNLL